MQVAERHGPSCVAVCGAVSVARHHFGIVGTPFPRSRIRGTTFRANRLGILATHRAVMLSRWNQKVRRRSFGFVRQKEWWKSRRGRMIPKIFDKLHHHIFHAPLRLSRRDCRRGAGAGPHRSSLQSSRYVTPHFSRATLRKITASGNTESRTVAIRTFLVGARRTGSDDAGPGKSTTSLTRNIRSWTVTHRIVHGWAAT